MRSLRTWCTSALLVVALCIVTVPPVVTLGGCAPFRLGTDDPVRSYANMQELWIVAMDVAFGLHDAGKVSDDQWVNVVNPVIQTGDAALDSMELLAVSGDEVSYADALARFRHALSDLQAHNANARALPDPSPD